MKRGAVWGSRDDWGWTVLHEVAASATRETVAWVCRESKGLNNLPDKLGRGPLLVGLMAGAELGAVEEMIEYGENPAQEDEVGRGCPEAAVLYCSADVVRFLLAHLNTLTGDKKVEVRDHDLLSLVQRGVQKQITLLYTCSERGTNARVKWSIISTHWPLCKTQFATKVRHHHISLFCDQIYMFH